jgi:hypothetical protein
MANEVTVFGIVVENELAEMFFIPSEDSTFTNILSSNPAVVEVTNIGYHPANGSVWDGENFIIPEGSGLSHGVAKNTEPGMSNSSTFAYIIDGICVQKSFFRPGPIGDRFSAALASSPIFVQMTMEQSREVRLGWTYNGSTFVRNN